FPSPQGGGRESHPSPRGGGRKRREKKLLVIHPLHEPLVGSAIAEAFQGQVVCHQQPPVLARDRRPPPLAVDPPAVQDSGDGLPAGRRLEVGRDAGPIQADRHRMRGDEQLGHAEVQRNRRSASGGAVSTRAARWTSSGRYSSLSRSTASASDS